jgi:glycosyltransferase involved in cell wall biosynthesis
LARGAIRAKAVIDWCEFRHGPLFELLQKYVPRFTPRNAVNSIGLKSALEAQSGRRFEVLPSGVFTSRYQSAPAAERSGILYLGRIEEHKNLALMLSSYELLLSNGYAGRLRIAGSGPALSNLQHMVKASEFADKIDVLGNVSEQQKITLLANSQVFLLTSRREGFPRVIAEAMASGLPVVTVKYPENGATHVVRQYGIGEVTDEAPETIAQGILAVIAEWDKYSEACISGSRSLDWEVLVDKLLETISAGSAGRA